MDALPIIILLFGLMYFLMIRPQRAKAQAQQRLLNMVAVGDEVLTVGGVYGIVQEIEPDEDGGDLVVEIAEGIHVRIARKAVATVVKPEDDEDDEDAESDESDQDDENDGEPDDDDVVDSEAEIVENAAEPPPGGVAEVNGEQDSVNPGAAEGTAPPERS
ncbi:preprotein translocase subunit YajC [Gaiella sp.]|uniref:preprotein translocase subunit YajC n=1 Tax=Gaiella sp. TaxID=2663207 RepID=UPI00326606F0